MDSIIGDRRPTLEDIKALYFTTRCLNESMRLYPQPPVLIRRALEDDVVGGYKVRQALGRGTTCEGLCSCGRGRRFGPCKRRVGFRVFPRDWMQASDSLPLSAGGAGLF